MRNLDKKMTARVEQEPLTPPDMTTVSLSLVHQFSGQIRRVSEQVQMAEVATNRNGITERLWQRILSGEGS